MRIQGEDFQVRSRIRTLDVYSAHADANGLVEWVQARQPIRGDIFLAHGEPNALDGLAVRLERSGFYPAKLVKPALDQAFDLTRDQAQRIGATPSRLQPGRAATLDWHNARADLLARLAEQLEDAPSDEARLQLLLAVERAMKAAAKSEPVP